MPFKDKQTEREYKLEYYHKNKDQIKISANKPSRKRKRKEYLKKYTKNNKLLIAETQSKCYQNKKEEYKERIRKRFCEHARLISDVKMSYGCMNAKCLWSGPYSATMLDFHHLNPDDKDCQVSQMACRSKPSIAREINKCVVLCSNCHRMFHSGELVLLENTFCNVNNELVVGAS